MVRSQRPEYKLPYRTSRYGMTIAPQGIRIPIYTATQEYNRRQRHEARARVRAQTPTPPTADRDNPLDDPLPPSDLHQQDDLWMDDPLYANGYLDATLGDVAEESDGSESVSSSSADGTFVYRKLFCIATVSYSTLG